MSSECRVVEIITPNKTYTELDSDFIMAVEGAQANRFIRDLRRDTLRGLQSKIDKGIAPILAPPGYQNNKHKKQGEKNIVPHNEYFSLMRKVFDLALTGNFSIDALAIESRKLGIKNSRDKYISKSQMSKVLHNPFYTGRFIYGKKLHPGKHTAMLTESEFDLLQDILGNRSRPRKQKHNFPLTGLIKCTCGSSITAELKTKRYKSGRIQYFTYYRCASKKNPNCPRPYVRDSVLEAQAKEILNQIKISQKFVDWAIKWLNEANKGQEEVRENQVKSLRNAYDNVMSRINNLLDLKLSPLNKDGELISDQEYVEKKKLLMEEKDRISVGLSNSDTHVNEWIKLTEGTFNFAVKAKERFEKGTWEEKKTIMRVVGSDLLLKDKKLEIQLRTPFLLIKNTLDVKTDSILNPAPGINSNLLGKTEDLTNQNVVWGG